MSDYKELIAKLRFYADTADDPIYGICINSPKVMFQAADTIEQLMKEYDAKPIKHGHWIAYEDNERECYCSNCEFPAGLDAYGYHNMQDQYCRFCGVKMDEVSE